MNNYYIALSNCLMTNTWSVCFVLNDNRYEKHGLKEPEDPVQFVISLAKLDGIDITVDEVQIVTFEGHFTLYYTQK